MSPGSKNSFPLEEQRILSAKKPTLWLRSRVLQSIRRFFIQHEYLEIETPYLIPAPAIEVYIDAFRAGNGFLHTSPELCMKRVLASGYPKIFQICKCFRQGERGALHLPEFTLLEWYQAGLDYMGLMDECEEMLLFVCHDLELSETIEYQGLTIALQRPWDRISVRQAFERYASLSLDRALAAGRFDEILVEEIEPHLGIAKPIFLYDYPVSRAALARLKEKERGLAERFELYLGRLELANAFSELTDAQEQRGRFQREKEEREQQGKEGYPLPDKFLRALPHMPPSAGIAFGIDRLVMLLANREKVDHVVAFTPEEL